MHPIAGSDQYILGAPLFERVEIRSAGGTTVITGGQSAMTIVDAVRRNGVPFEQAVITHAELLGSTLDFTMR
jgi:putative alpha-1,2-mannosidase